MHKVIFINIENTAEEQNLKYCNRKKNAHFLINQSVLNTWLQALIDWILNLIGC